MKKIVMAAAAALSLSGMAAATAAPQADDAARAGSVQISGAGQYRLGTGEFNNYGYRYMMSNGQQLQFTERNDRYYLELKGGERTRLYPVAAGRFQTEQGVDVKFSDLGQEVAITNLERLPQMAGLVVQQDRVIARR